MLNRKIEVAAYPLIVYVHVPKTAGRTIKKFLNICTPRGEGYIESAIHNKIDFLTIARNSDWISGHLSRETLSDALGWLDRPIEYFSTVREPVEQIISHLNFSIDRIYRKNYYNSHDHNEIIIDSEVAATDFSKPASVIAFLLRNSERYLNIQSRFLLGTDFYNISNDEVMLRLSTYTFIANEFNLGKIFRSFGFYQIPLDPSSSRENVAVRHIKREVFDTPQLQEFFAYHHHHDLKLYANILNASWPREDRISFRPSLLGTELFTHENFDERAYLFSNPDVAAAVNNGGFDSGLAHFTAYGHAEERTNRRWIFAPE